METAGQHLLWLCCRVTDKRSKVTGETTVDPAELQREIAATDAKFANIIPEDVAFNINMSESDLRDTESELRSISELALQRDSDAHATLVALANTLAEFDDTDDPETMRTAAENATADSTHHADPVLMGNETLSRDLDRLTDRAPAADEESRRRQTVHEPVTDGGSHDQGGPYRYPVRPILRKSASTVCGLLGSTPIDRA